MPETPVIVLTGGIASGKSTVAKMLADEGGAVISADALAREVLAAGSPGHQEVVNTWGREILTAEGEVNRELLGRLVFNDPQQRRLLEEITHPRIFCLMQERLAEAREKVPFVVLEIPLYFETGRVPRATEVWVVYADRATQMARLRERNGLSLEEADRRLAAQWSLEKKCALADRVIDNSGSEDETRAAVRRALADFFRTRAREGEKGPARLNEKDTD